MSVRISTFVFFCVRLTGLEPARRETLDPKSSASTNSATGAFCGCKGTNKRAKNQIYFDFLLREPFSCRFNDFILCR